MEIKLVGIISNMHNTCETELLTLSRVATDPDLITTQLTVPSGEEVVFRPLLSSDVKPLTAFLMGLSPQTRDFSTYDGYDNATAQSFCDAIARYDKLRMVAIVAARIVALFEFSLYISVSDKERYYGYGIKLDEAKDIRFGPCIADEYQNQGFGSHLLCCMLDVASRFGKDRVILWGGVLTNNYRAIRYYEKNGFQMVGIFQNDRGHTCQDGILML